MSSSKKESNSKRDENTDKEIQLITSQRKYRVNVQQFSTYSLKVRKLSEIGRLPDHIDLSPYDENAVKTLVGYIKNHDQKNIKLSFYALADLLDLSRSLLMPGLLKQLEDTLVGLASQKTDALIQALIIVGGERSICGGLAARRKIEAIAANQFQNLVQHKLFGYIPPIVFANVLARCDLNIEKEMDAVDAGIVWIWKQKKRLISCVLVFSRIRSAQLSRGDRDTIRERFKSLPNGEKFIPIVMTTLSSTFCRRCCVIKEHIDKGTVRCGVPNPSTDATVDLSKLPLSSPSKIMKKSKSKDKSKKNSERSEKKEKSKRKQRRDKTFREKMKSMKTESAHGEKSSKSIRSPSKSSKSHRSKKSSKANDSDKSQSSRHSKRKSEKGESRRSKKLRRAMNKKLSSSRTEPDDE